MNSIILHDMVTLHIPALQEAPKKKRQRKSKTKRVETHSIVLPEEVSNNSFQDAMARFADPSDPMVNL